MNQQELTDLYCTRPQNFAWFLGAGTSRSSGLPTAEDVIWYMKRRYYCREENQEISRHDVQNPQIRSIIQAYMDSKGFPARWSEEEYATYFEKIFGEDRELQRRFLNEFLKEDKLKLSVGNRILGGLLSLDLIKVAFTTNFDTVVEKSVAEVSGNSLSAYHLEGAHSINDAYNNEEFPIYCKLHGDFRYDSIKNLPQDLASQNQDLSKCLLNAGNRFGFIVAGYSGRDESVMNLFYEVINSHNPFPNGLYWLGIKGLDMPPPVEKLLSYATEKGVCAEYVSIETFDAFLLRIWRNIENKPKELNARVQKSQLSKVNIPLLDHGKGIPLLRLNALPISDIPRHCLEVRFQDNTDRERIREAEGNFTHSVITSRTFPYYCWGKSESVRKCFSNLMASCEAVEIPPDLSISENSLLKGFFENTLSKALARNLPLLSRFTRNSAWLIVDPHSEDKSRLDPLFKIIGSEAGEISGLYTETNEFHPNSEKVSWSEALRISIDIKDGRSWLLIDPDIWIWPARARKSAVLFMTERKRNRYNNKYCEILEAWIEVLFDEQNKISVTPFINGEPSENPVFNLYKRTAYSKRSQI